MYNVTGNCIFASKHVSIGSEESGGVRNITIEDSILGAVAKVDGSQVEPFGGFAAGVHLKAERGRGGYIKGVTLQRLQFLGPISQPIFISMFYSDARNATNASATPSFADITIRDIVVLSATGVVDGKLGQPMKKGWAGALVGLPEQPIKGLVLHNVSVRLSPHAKVKPNVEPWLCADVLSGSATLVTPAVPPHCFASNENADVKIDP